MICQRRNGHRKITNVSTKRFNMKLYLFTYFLLYVWTEVCVYYRITWVMSKVLKNIGNFQYLWHFSSHAVVIMSWYCLVFPLLWTCVCHSLLVLLCSLFCCRKKRMKFWVVLFASFSIDRHCFCDLFNHPFDKWMKSKTKIRYYRIAENMIEE